MPPRTRKPAEKPAEAPAPRVKADGDICRQCWPAGWRETSTNAGCIHGNWTR